ncbi:MAG: glucoamylase family protein [Bacteroidota bacterium]
MTFLKKYLTISLLICSVSACKKGSDPTPVTPTQPAKTVSVKDISISAMPFNAMVYNVTPAAPIRVRFSEPVTTSTVNGAVSLRDAGGATVPVTITLQNGDSTLLVQPASPLPYLAKYNFRISEAVRSASGGGFTTPVSSNFLTQIDSSSKFPVLGDDALLDLVQKQTFKYFWDFGHPTSGLSRERSNGDNNVVTSGGSGFGIMSIITAIERKFITRAEGFARIQKITGFLKNTAVTVKGAYPHWLNGNTGAIIPFSQKDDGADLVETSYLVQGLLCARQYFTGAGEEATLRADINMICNRVEWDFFRKGSEEVLYWHYSNTYNWDMNLKIRGWNECLITYVLAASSTTHTIPATVYTNGWAGNGTNGFINGNTYLTYQLPLGPPYGGPLFFAHYSFLGIDPKGLTDQYANYMTQNKNHTLINYTYCTTNPLNYFGYSDRCWGLTASDIPNGYTASSPTNDIGVIAPTAALSSFPYTPTESMKALKFFYYTIGDKLFKDYGFIDAFALKDPWFADSHLAIDQGPIIVMIENHRSGLLWNLFTSCPEVKAGMKKLGFTAPYL